MYEYSYWDESYTDRTGTDASGRSGGIFERSTPCVPRLDHLSVSAASAVDEKHTRRNMIVKCMQPGAVIPRLLSDCR